LPSRWRQDRGLASEEVFCWCHEGSGVAEVRRHYDRVAAELRPSPGGVTLPARVYAIVLVSKLHTPTLRVLAYARATRPTSLTAVTVSSDPEESDELLREWGEREIPVPLRVLHSPYRDVTGPVLDYVKDIRRTSPRDLVAVFIPEYVVGHWWEQLLHNTECAAAQGAVVVPARGDGHQCAVAARLGRGC